LSLVVSKIQLKQRIPTKLNQCQVPTGVKGYAKPGVIPGVTASLSNCPDLFSDQ